MAITIPHASSAIEGISTISVASSATFTSTTGNLLIALCNGDTATAEGATPLADGGTNSWTMLGKSSNIGSDPTWSDIGYAKNITGKASEAATFALNATGFPNICLLEVAGCDTAAPSSVAVAYTSQVASTSNLNSALITPAAGDHIIVMIGCESSGAVASASVTNNGTGTASWTTIKNDSTSGLCFLVAYTVITADGTHTYGVTYTSGGSGPAGAATITGIAAFKAAGSAVITLPLLPPLTRILQVR
jgi:hypothetical protein